MLGNTAVDTESSGHEKQDCRSFHETSGWIANTVAREETWTSNPGQMVTTEEWGRLRAFETALPVEQGCKCSLF